MYVGEGTDVAKRIKAVDFESTMRWFNYRRSPIIYKYEILDRLILSIFLIKYWLQRNFLVHVSQAYSIFL